MISSKEAYRIAVETVKPDFKPETYCYEYKGCYVFPLLSKSGEMLLDMLAFVDVDNGDVYPFDPLFDFDKLMKSNKIQIELTLYDTGKDLVSSLLPKG